MKRKILYSNYGFIGKNFESDTFFLSIVNYEILNLVLYANYTTSDVTLHKNGCKKRNLFEKFGKVAYNVFVCQEFLDAQFWSNINTQS